MRLYAFSTEGITRKITGAISEIESFGKDRVILTNPSASAEFPCCVVQPPLQKEVYLDAGRDLSITVEVWGSRQMEVLRLFDQTSKKLQGLNLKLTNNTPLHRTKSQANGVTADILKAAGMQLQITLKGIDGMAEFNADAKTTPKGTMRTELWYAKSGDGAEKKQIFMVQEIPKLESAPEQITYTALESSEEFATPGKKKSEPLEVPVLYVAEQHKELKTISESHTRVWFFVKLPDETAAESGKPLTYKFPGTFHLAGDAISDGDMIKDTITIYKDGKVEETEGLSSADL